MIIPGITFFIICGLLIAWAVLFATNFYRTSYYNGGTAMETIRSFTVFLAARRLGVATYILYQAAVIIAVGLCVYNLIRNPSASTTSGAVIVLVTLISLLMVLWPALRAMQIMMLPSEILMAPRTNIATTTAIATAGVIGTDFVLLEYFTQAAQYLALVFLLLVANRAPKQESE
ncbi:hypothetical protein BU16DRAFT_526964 [Lophium mytilinum]|uniref:Uncharacterized protein n=1 Tax=Lophium mytilinum TaxID=390894 RepID=A0A6A6QSF5_9PEZI|nr:hypothetical protein BU16DRAFT_526964 [Lophium mytilinum]